MRMNGKVFRGDDVQQINRALVKFIHEAGASDLVLPLGSHLI